MRWISAMDLAPGDSLIVRIPARSAASASVLECRPDPAAGALHGAPPGIQDGARGRPPAAHGARARGVPGAPAAPASGRPGLGRAVALRPAPAAGRGPSVLRPWSGG